MTLRPLVIPVVSAADARAPERVADQRAAARRALARCGVEVGLAADTQWSQDHNRVPQAVGGWQWSISHKPAYAAALIAETPIGIDIEALAPRRNMALFERLADGREWEIAGGQSWSTFFRLWTAKEATLKANGRGISGLGACRLVHVSRHHYEMALGGCGWRVTHYYHDEHIAGVACATAVPHDVAWRLCSADGQILPTS